MRQLLIGLDAMEWTLVEKWASEGKLPTFRSLMKRGSRARLISTASSLPDTVWGCICTGLNPAKLEKFFYVQYDARTMGLRHLSDDVIQQPPFWHHLSTAGVRVGIADVPHFGMKQPVNGFQLSNWGAHATKTARASQPASLLDEIDTRFGRHPVGDCDKVDGKPESLQDLRNRIVAGTRLHGEMFRHLMSEQQWDVFFACFSAPHCIGHHFWNGMDSSQSGDGSANSTLADGAIEDVYRAVDHEIGEMLSVIDSNTRVMVFAGHGMGPVYHASWNLPQMLELWGYGTQPARRAAAINDPRDAKVNPWRILKMVVPGPIQYAIRDALPQFLQDQLLFLWYRGGKKWEGSRAFAIPNNDSVGAVRISVKGRDKNGLVEPGAEYERVCRDIADALIELTDKEGGRRLVSSVTLTHEVFRGPYLELLPDLTVLWDQSFAWRTVYSPRFGSLRIRQQDARSGTHTPYGFALVVGPDVQAGAEMLDCSLYDIAPTVLKTAGVQLPDDLDGRPLPL